MKLKVKKVKGEKYFKAEFGTYAAYGETKDKAMLALISHLVDLFEDVNKSYQSVRQGFQAIRRLVG